MASPLAKPKRTFHLIRKLNFKILSRPSIQWTKNGCTSSYYVLWLDGNILWKDESIPKKKTKQTTRYKLNSQTKDKEKKPRSKEKEWNKEKGYKFLYFILIKLKSRQNFKNIWIASGNRSIPRYINIAL